MADHKRLVVVLEVTGAMGGHWRTIYSDYLQKLIRSFCGNVDANPDGPIVELALVLINAHGNHSSCVVQRGGWVRNLDYYFDTLEAMAFSGGGFCDAAIAEGLAEVLMVFPPPKEGQIQKNGGLQRHCILVAASNPYPLSTPVYRPLDNKGQPQSRLCDAETLVKSFPQCCVSLSVICPRQLPKLKSLYYAAKRNASAVDHTISIATNPQYLVLISDDFKSDCADLSQLGITILPSGHTEVASVSGRSSTPGSSVPGQIIRRAPTNASAQSSITSMAESAKASGAEQLAQHTAHCSLTSAISDMSWSSILGMAQRLARQEQLSVQSGTSRSQNTMKGVVQSATPATGTTMPAVSALQSPQSGYVKLWEGNLTCELRSEIVFLTRLQAYRKSTATALLAEDWPSTMKIYNAISQEYMAEKALRAAKVDHLAFVALSSNQHGILKKFQERNYCAAIKLPSQRLMLSVSDPASTWIGTLFPNACRIVNHGHLGSNLHGYNSSHQQQERNQLVGQEQVSPPDAKA